MSAQAQKDLWFMLDSRGFRLGEEIGLIPPRSDDPHDRNTFYVKEVEGTFVTYAVDGEGLVWAKDGSVDLTNYGFGSFMGNRIW